MECLVTYQKKTGEVFFRSRQCPPMTPIGETTSMGWKVLTVHYEQDGNYLVYSDYMRAIRRNIRKKQPLKKQIVNYLINQLRKI